jgi:hypothetical protein
MKVACGVVKKREKSSMVDRCFGSDQPWLDVGPSMADTTWSSAHGLLP